MYTLILDHAYDREKPAIDFSDFAEHARCENTVFSSVDNAMTFMSANAKLHVRKTDTWDDLAAIVVATRLKLSNTPQQRRNVIEGDGSFAVYVDSAGAIHFDVFAATIANSANWVSLASPPGAVPNDKWITIKVQHNGLNEALIAVDDIVVATRSDYASSVISVGGHGVSVGNWTLSNQYPLMGSISNLRVWKYDPRPVLTQFARRLSDDERSAWNEIFACLQRVDDVVSNGTLRDDLDGFFRLITKKIRQAKTSVRRELNAAIKSYLVAWDKRESDSDDFVDSLDTIARIVLNLCDESEAKQLRELVRRIEVTLSGHTYCFNKAQLLTRDAQLAMSFQRASRAPHVISLGAH